MALAFTPGACAGSPNVAPAPPPPMMEPGTDPPPPLPSQAEVPPTPVPEPVETEDLPGANRPRETEPEPAPAPPPASTERAQDPVAIITARDAAFLIDYANSEPKAKAAAQCEKEAQGDAAKIGACLAKAREDFLPDVLRFRKDTEKVVSLLVYKRNGSALREISIGTVSLIPEPPDGVLVKFSGRQKGARPIFRGRSQGKIVVLNGYSIELEDPDLGRLRYDAKIGLVSD